MKIELTLQEKYLILSALENEAENDLKLIKDDCDCDVYTSEPYVIDYQRKLELIKKINELKEEK